MRDTIEIGSAPCDEDCAQVGSPNYRDRAGAECTAFIGQIRRVFGPEPSGARLKVQSFPHDFGTYYEVVVQYETENEEAAAYAMVCCDRAPNQWDEAARQELNLIPEGGAA